MAWPTPQDYNEAIQNPGLNFDDAELQGGSVELTSLGLPRPITGNFASVYRVHTGSRDWAIRCFWREFSDLQERYAAISRHLKSARLPYMVQFEYLPRGIQVRGAWYPILKMEWVEGDLLHDFVSSHLGDRTKIRRLGEGWLSMLESLERAGTAHGDLQHGNVLVVNGELKLVDYDGMYVPALAGKSSHELGHQNYQHPARRAAHFSVALDRFSGWTIYLSLLAVSHQPDLWTQLKGGDECLLLRKHDFEQPAKSNALQLLAQHGNAEIRLLAGYMQKYLQIDPLLIPAPSSTQRSTPVNGPRSARFFPRSNQRRHRFPLSSATGAQRTAGNAPIPEPPDWVREHLKDEASPVGKRFASSARVPAWCLLLSAVLVVVSMLWIQVAPAPAFIPAATLGAALGVDILLLAFYFRRDPVAAERRRLLSRWRYHCRRLDSLAKSIARQNKMRERAMERLRRREQVRDSSRIRFQRDHHKMQSDVETTLDEIRAVVEVALAQLEARERDVRREALQERQRRFVQDRLRSCRLWSASIAGVEWWVKLPLLLCGINSADHISSKRLWVLKRFDPNQIKPLIAWRAEKQVEAKHAMPRRLPSDITKTISARFHPRRERLHLCLQRAEAEASTVVNAVQDALAADLAELDGRSDCEREALAEECATIDQQTESLRQEEVRLYVQLQQTVRELEPFRDVTFYRYMLRAASAIRSGL